MPVQTRPPNWTPLKRLLHLLAQRDLSLDDFMNMGSVVNEFGVAIHLYKHRETRRYLNVDAAGHAYLYEGLSSVDGRQAYAPYLEPVPAVADLVWHAGRTSHDRSRTR